MTFADFLSEMFNSMWPWLRAVAAFLFFMCVAGAIESLPGRCARSFGKGFARSRSQASAQEPK